MKRGAADDEPFAFREVSDELRTVGEPGGIYGRPFEAIAAGKTIFLSIETEKAFRKVREALADRAARRTPGMRVRAHQQTVDGATGYVVWLEPKA